MVGYSRLAGADEDRTLARLRALRSDLIDPTIAVHHGRIVKRTGDGRLVEFRSVVDAVRCAIEVQNAMVERNAGVPEDRRIVFRIGIHLGDIVEESRRRSDGRRRQHRRAVGGHRRARGDLLVRGRLSPSQRQARMEVTDLGPTQLKNIASQSGLIRCKSACPTKPKPAQESRPKAPADEASPRLAAAGRRLLASLVVAALAAGVYVWHTGLASRIDGRARGR